jgi:hypothetical protein
MRDRFERQKGDTVMANNYKLNDECFYLAQQ